MKMTGAPPDDEYRIPCPRLGHGIHFSYCRSENLGTPCFKVLDCWHPHFEVQEFLQSRLSREQWEVLVNRPPAPRILSLLDLISRAERHRDKTGES